MTAEWLDKAAAQLGGKWVQRAERFKQRLDLEGLAYDAAGSRLFRDRVGEKAEFGGRSVWGSMLTYVRGQATASDAVEDVFESVADMQIAARAEEIAEANEELSAGEAWGQAVREMAAKVKPVIEGMALLSESPQLKAMAKEGNWTEDRLYMATLEAMSHIAKSEFLSKRESLPASWRGGLDAAYDALDYAHEMKQFADAYKAVKEAGSVDVAPLEDVLAAQGVVVNDVFRDARVDEQVIASWRKAKGMVAARAAVEGTGAVGVQEALESAEESEREIAEAESARDAVPPLSEEEQKEAAQQLNEELASTPPPPAFSAAPEEMKGVFLDDSCTCCAGGFYSGWVAVDKLRDSAEIQQVKVGDKGKHGVTNALVGEFQLSAPPIIVWRRKNGDLEVISGRHRYALAEACGVKFIRADVYNEDAEHDAKWARLMDFENNMRDDQADEKTAFIYVRETGYDDETLYNKGLMRNKTKSRRGAMIARHAREELATRFMNDAVSAKDAETICTMTKDIADKGRIEEIQRRCCMLLDERKSWEYIGAMVQLMASKKSVYHKQGLLDLGADFEADLARAAKYIETCTKQLNEAVAVMKSGRKMSGKQAELARRLGQLTTSAEDSQQRLDALMTMKAMFENIGMYSDLVAAAQMWDGKTPPDAVGMALEYGMREAQANGEEAKMSVEERLAQAEAEANRRAAEEATGSLFGGSFSVTGEELSRWGESAAQVMDTRETGKRRMHMMKMPRILRELGCSHEYLDIESDTILKAWKDGVPDRRTGHKHNLTREQILRLPVEMADPVMVFEGKVDSPKYRAFVVLTEMRVGEKSVMVAVHLDKKIKNTKVDIIASAYERENNNLFKKLKVLYVDKSRVPAWHPLADAILAGEGSLRNPDGSIVLMKEDIVKNYPHNRGKIVSAEGRKAAFASLADNSDVSFSVTREDYRIAREFNALEQSVPVAVDVPEAYAEDDKVARGVLKSITDELRREPVEFSDGSKATVSGRTRKEIEHHFADRRIIAAFGKMRELAKSARYIYSAENSERGKNSKQDIAGFHYYLAKGNFPEQGGDAYVCISVAEFKNGDRVYDLNLTDVDEVAKNKSEADSLPATRVSRTGPTEAASLYKGRIHRIKEFVNYINAQNDGFSASVMTESQRREAVKNELARVAAMDKQVAVLADDWERVLGDLDRVSRGGEETKLGDGARLYAEMVSLISATRAVLPPHLARLGNLNGLMHWAAVYSEMVQHGELPLRGGVIKGAIAEKFLQAMQKRRDALLLQGLSEQEAKEAMAQVGAEKLSAALKKVAVACRDQLNRYVKERAWERIETLAERAMPKSEPGHRSHKGKMDAAHYKEMSAALHALNLTEEEMEKEQNELLGRIRALTGTEEGYEETYRELQDALNRLNLYGCWHAMSASHALKAADAFAVLVQDGRQQWKETLDVQRRHKLWLMGRMAEGMQKTATANAVNEEQNTDAVGVLRAPARGAKDLIYGLMNMSHLLQAKRRELGDTVVTYLQNMLLHAQEGKHREKSRRDRYIAERLRIFFGCKSEADATRTLNELQRRRTDHNIRTWKLEKHTYTLDRAEAEEWAAMTREQREEVRKKDRAEAEKKKLAPPERVAEADIARLQAEMGHRNCALLHTRYLNLNRLSAKSASRFRAA